MPADMKLKEETPTKIVLETDPSSRKWGEYLRMLVIPLLFLAGALIITNFATWLDWILIALAILIEVIMVLVIYSEWVDVTVTIDADSKHATRIEKFLFITTRNIQWDFDQVSRVRIQMEEHGHHHRLYLESLSKETFQVSIAFAVGSYNSQQLMADGRKIGRILNKPVVFRHTDLGNLISEDTIQS